MIKELSKVQMCIFLLGATLMVVGAGLYVFAITPFIANLVGVYTMHVIGAVVFAIGACCFASMQMLQRYEGSDFTLRRLRKIQLFGDICFLLAALFMLVNAFEMKDGYPNGIVFSFFKSHNMVGEYFQYIRNNWVIFLLVAAILEVYTTHRISNQLNKK